MRIGEIIEQAIDIEKLARDYYREQERKYPQRYVAQAMEQLANEEQKHIDILNEFPATLEGDRIVSLPDLSATAAVWKALTEALEQIREVIQPHTDEVTAVQKAIMIEKQSLAIYDEAQRTAPPSAGQRVFSFLAEQDVRHLAYLENLLDRLLVLYQEPPETRPQL